MRGVGPDLEEEECKGDDAEGPWEAGERRVHAAPAGSPDEEGQGCGVGKLKLGARGRLGFGAGVEVGFGVGLGCKRWYAAGVPPYGRGQPCEGKGQD